MEILAADGTSSGLLQGFSSNISQGGICVELKSFGRDADGLLHRPDSRLELTINTAFGHQPVKASARIAWLKRDDGAAVKFWIGAEYTSIDEKSRRRIFKHAKRLLWMPRLAQGALLTLVLAAGALYWHNQGLVTENQRLVREQVESADRKSNISSQLYQIEKRKRALEAELAKLREANLALEKKSAALTSENEAQRKLFEAELSASRARQSAIADELTGLRSGSEGLRSAYQRVSKKEAYTATASLKQMVEWVRSHQNRRTGLVASFEGDTALEGTAFTYDQALAVQVFILFGEREAARDVLRFFTEKAQRRDGAFYNAYNAVYAASDETTIHTGPNIWLGIAALQYEDRYRDGQFLELAESIAAWLETMQDSEGGLRGGPGLGWYSTEHHLDAYAFFQMLARVTGQPRYRDDAERVLAWLKKYAYSTSEKRLNRGKGDATIATDTFSWAIAAIGPAALEKAGFDTEAIIAFAEENCEVEVSYERAGAGTAKVRGFDFAKAKNAGRGGVVSVEWTAQMIVAYQIMARHYEALGDAERAGGYRSKADFFLNELQKLMITSPSRTGQGRGCLPYASLDNVDTGHGWRTPRGRSTGSVSATAYGIFAWVGYNPFDLDSKPVVS